MKKTIILALVALLALSVVGPAAAKKKKKPKPPAAPVAVELSYYMRRDGCGTDNDNTHLSLTDGEDTNCPYSDSMLNDAYLALGEVGDPLPEIDLWHRYPATAGTPIKLDPSRKITGNVAIGGDVTPGQLYGLGAGQVEYEIQVVATVDGEEKIVGELADSYVATPNATQDVAYEFAVDPALAGATVTDLSLNVLLHGQTVGFAGMVVHSEKSLMKVPAFQ